MTDSMILFFSATSSFLFLCVGIVVGWTAKDFVHDYMWSRDEISHHPEMYDENGIMINEELLSVKFINEDEKDDETSDA
tara:strand:+ start:1197 stop:1433 length:237 start_codon:yes stop_codon:yes gene_type:complete